MELKLATEATAVDPSVAGERNTIDRLRAELDEYYTEMRALAMYEPDEIFLRLAGWSARASEIRCRLVRQESRRAQAFRTREIEPFLDEIDRQFKLYSRVVSVRETEYKLQGKTI